MSARNGKCGPAFKFKVVLEALRAEGPGVEAEVTRAYLPAGRQARSTR